MALSVERSSDVAASDEVEGTLVSDYGGQKHCSIHKLMVDVCSEQVRYPVVAIRTAADAALELCPVPWSLMVLDGTKGQYFAPMDRVFHPAAPRYAPGEVPEFTLEYNKVVHRHFGISVW